MDRTRLDALELLKVSATFHGKTKTVPTDRHQWTAITAEDCEILAGLNLPGFRITVSALNLHGLDKAIEAERRKVEAAEAAERRRLEREEEERLRRQREDMEVEMRARYAALAPAPAAPSADQLATLIAQAVASALAAQQKPES